MVTSNLAFAQWTSVFGDAALTAALLDRLTHHSTIHEFNWESRRFAESLSKKQKSRKSVSREVAATSGPAGPNKEMNSVGAPGPTGFMVFLLLKPLGGGYLFDCQKHSVTKRKRGE